MSEIEKSETDAVEEPVQQDSAPPPAGDTAGRPRGPGNGVAWLALLLAIAAACLFGYSLIRDWRDQRAADVAGADVTEALASFGERIDDSADDIAALQRRLADLEAGNAAREEEILSQADRLREQIDLLQSLAPRVAGLEGSLAALQGSSEDSRNAWLLAEAEYFMQIANSQLQLAGKPELAALALGMADERITRIGDPGLTEVRRALADELAALEALGRPDIEGASLTLASLAHVVGSLPLRDERALGRDPESATDAQQGSLGRAWGSVKGAIAKFVRVTPPDGEGRPLLAPQSEYFLRTNLTLQLQAARLALLRSEQALFEQSLDDAGDWIGEYFDQGSTQVASALATIRELRELQFATATPDISLSLRLLRQYRNRNTQ